jgi:hypothetical protein
MACRDPTQRLLSPAAAGLLGRILERANRQRLLGLAPAVDRPGTLRRLAGLLHARHPGGEAEPGSLTPACLADSRERPHSPND